MENILVYHLELIKGCNIERISAVCYFLSSCNCSPTSEYFSVLCLENKKYLLELKESLLIMRYYTWMNQNIRSACLNEFLSHCLLFSLDFHDQVFSYFEQLFRFVEKLQILIISMWNGLIMNRRNLFKTCGQWFKKKLDLS